MVEAYNFLKGSQTDINRRLLRKIEALENKDAENNEILESILSEIGDDSVSDSIKGRIKALEDAT